MSQPPFASGVSIQGGGSYQWPGKPRHVSPEREFVYSGADLGFVQAIAVDPEGRQLIAKFFDSHNLYRIDLTGAEPGEPELLYTPGEIPHLREVRHIVFRDHRDLGRFLVMDEARGGSPAVVGDLSITLVPDTNNDGLFDSGVITRTMTEWMSDPTMTLPGKWDSFFGT